MLSLVDAHHQHVNPLGALPPGEWLPRFVDHTAPSRRLRGDGEIGQHLGRSNILPYLVKDKQRRQAGDDHKSQGQAYHEKSLRHIAGSPARLRPLDRLRRPRSL